MLCLALLLNPITGPATYWTGRAIRLGRDLQTIIREVQ